MCRLVLSVSFLAALSAPAVVYAQPAAPEPAEARVASAVGRVEVTPPGAGSAARRVAPDDVLAAGAQVTVHHEGEVTIRYTNAGELQVEEDSHLAMFGPSFTPARGSGTVRDTSLARGSARVVVNPGATITLFTPGGRVAMTRGEFRVHVDSQRATRVVAYRGRARVTGPDRGFFIGAGTGARVDNEHAGTPAFPPVPVPRAPVWTQPFPPASLALGGTATAEARFAAPPGQRHPSHGWVIELARDAAFDDVVFERELPTADALFRAERLPEGEYFARVSSMDGERFESIPSATQRFQVIAPRVIPGTAMRRAEVLVPPGLFCRLDGEIPLGPGVPYALVPARRHELQCSATADMANPTRVEIPAEQAGELNHEVQLVGAPWSAAGGSGTVEIRLRDASGRPFPYANVTLRPGAGVTAGSVIEGAERGVYLTDVRWAASAPLVLEVVVNDALRFTERLGGPAAR